MDVILFMDVFIANVASRLEAASIELNQKKCRMPRHLFMKISMRVSLKDERPRKMH
jgi:uncharacterized membrane protein YqjE